jgi:integration host factor subunit beta
MTRSDLIAHLADHFPQLVLKDAKYALGMILKTMTEACIDGKRIEIRGFASFDIRLRPARVGRNPKSGEKVQVSFFSVRC